MKSIGIETTEENNFPLDDGYRSTISCIVNVTNCFEYKEEKILSINGNKNLSAKISDNGLEIFYSDTIQTYNEYIKATNDAEALIKKITPYINCATRHGNFFQLGNVFIKEPEKVPFIPQKIKFRVSNEIIPNLIKPLYGDNPECGLREIIQNACDATKELENIKTDKKYIELHIHKESENTILTIRDYGIGMTEDILLNKYFVIGETSKKGNNKNLVGQFGIGALAAFLLGDKIAVKTKPYNSNLIYSFEYELTSNENNPIAVSIAQDENFSHGTKVSIILNNDLSKLEKQNLEKKLKINEWYVLPDVEIKYTYNNEEQKIKSFSEELYEWKSISKDDKNELDIKYLDKKKGEDNSNYNGFSQEAKIIYNGLIVPTQYEFKSKYLKKKPYISVSSSSNLISLNLERSKIEKGLKLIIDPVETEFIKQGLTILEKEKNRIVSEDGTILMTTYNNDFIKDIPLFFTNKGFGILNSYYMYNNFVVLYSNYGVYNVKLDDLEDGKKYIFKNFIPNKSDLAYYIEHAENIVLDNNIIKTYFYDASSYNLGFKTDTMKFLYENFFSKNYDTSLNAQRFWEKHNKEKKNYLKHFLMELQIFVYLKIDNLLNH